VNDVNAKEVIFMNTPFSPRRTQSRFNSPLEETLEHAWQKISSIHNGSKSFGSAIRYGKFAGTEVLGTDFLDIAGARGWVFAFWSESDPLVRICFASRGELPEHITLPDRANLQSAKTAWEAFSGTMPN
jgi:hypothetical protein